MSEANKENALLLAAMAGLVPELMPPDDVRLRMRAAILARAAGAGTSTHNIRADEGEWQPLLPGIAVKTLHRNADAGAQTTLWRLEPGACIPPHTHSRDEECLLLEGSILLDGSEYFPGDYVFAKAGESHGVISAPRGALFLIRGELVPDAAALARLNR